jgi:leader peptidase (prepilin peptidase) / N-methyltransferase
LPNNWLIATIYAAVLGAAVAPMLVAKGLRQLDERYRRSAATLVATSLAGAAAAAAAVQAARRVDSGWWWLPALLTWALTVAAAANCDGLTQRIPSPLLRTGAAVSAALMVGASLVTQDWRGLLVTLFGSAAAGAILALCWRFAGAGFGDVRLATVGGIGLGHTTDRNLVLALLTFMALTMTQAICTYIRARDRKAHFAYGPGLVVGFLVAAAA